VTDGAKLSLEDHDWSSSSVLALSAIESPERQECQPATSIHEERWYAAYTCANHEKRVAAQLQARSIEHLLPLYSSMRRWKDRRVRVDFPLFPGYVFVRHALCDRLRVLQIPSLVRLVGFGGQPRALAEGEIALMRASMSGTTGFAPHPYLCIGSRVRIMRGPLRSAEGVLVRYKNQLRVVLSIELIARSVSVEVDSADIERIF
jgi:transcription antitermination factor NusG